MTTNNMLPWPECPYFEGTDDFDWRNYHCARAEAALSRLRIAVEALAYWSQHEPSQADARAFRQITGLDVKRRNFNGINEYLYRGVA